MAVLLGARNVSGRAASSSDPNPLISTSSRTRERSGVSVTTSSNVASADAGEVTTGPGTVVVVVVIVVVVVVVEMVVEGAAAVVAGASDTATVVGTTVVV